MSSGSSNNGGRPTKHGRSRSDFEDDPSSTSSKKARNDNFIPIDGEYLQSEQRPQPLPGLGLPSPALTPGTEAEGKQPAPHKSYVKPWVQDEPEDTYFGAVDHSQRTVPPRFGGTPAISKPYSRGIFASPPHSPRPKALRRHTRNASSSSNFSTWSMSSIEEQKQAEEDAENEADDEREEEQGEKEADQDLDSDVETMSIDD